MKSISKTAFVVSAVLVSIFYLFTTGFAEEYTDRVVFEFHTVVDFYTNIKGVEYVYCVGYLIVFPFLYNAIFKE